MIINEFVGSKDDSVEGVTINEADENWVTGQVDGHWFQAKVFAEPSEYGINEGRVSKLTISKTDSWPGFDPKKLVMNYDRGWDFGRKNNKPLQKLLKVFA